MTVRIDVCIATFHRPEGLRRLLDALLAQETEGRFSIGVCTADNDARGSANAVIDEFISRGVDIHYAVEPVQSISLARNRALGMAVAEWIAITDDDLLPDRRWLISLYDAAIRFEADVVHGWTPRTFPPGTPLWVTEHHVRPSPPTGSTKDYFQTTGNVLIRRSILEEMSGPFDPRFGLTGGEDSDLFRRLDQRGNRMIFCREALVRAEVPAQRATLGWLVRNRFRNGSIARDVMQQPLTVAVALRSMLIIMREIALSILLWAPVVVSLPAREAAMRKTVATILYASWFAGRLYRVTGRRYREYALKS